MKRAFQIDFVRARGLLPHHRFLDLGCGTLRGGLPVIAYLEPGHYHGIDVRPEALDEARKELAEADLARKEPVLHLGGDFDAMELGVRFDVVWAFSVLFHLSDAILPGALRFVRRHLADGGVFYANVNAAARPTGEWRGFPVMSHDLAFYEQQAADVGLNVTDLGQLRNLGHVSGVDDQDNQHMLEFRAR
jgi:SAM-dependent methyltransferase